MDNGSDFTGAGYWSNDSWAGARKACDELNATLPTRDDLVTICTNDKEALGIPSFIFWSSTLYSGFPANLALSVGFSSCNSSAFSRDNTYQALCVGN